MVRYPERSHCQVRRERRKTRRLAGDPLKGQLTHKTPVDSAKTELIEQALGRHDTCVSRILLVSC